MNKLTHTDGTEEKDGEGYIDTLTPWGVYAPPSSGQDTHQVCRAAVTHEGCEKADVGVLPLPNEPHGGYVRIVDAKGKSFPCAFSRPIGYVIETVAVDEEGSPSHVNGTACDIMRDDQPTPIIKAKVQQQKRTVTEERLHPEEALFLHMRGLLRIEPTPTRDPIEKSQAAATNSTMSTQDLFCKMLPDCKIPLAAYLAYAHLRAQGYILIRYTDQRLGLLCGRDRPFCSTKLELEDDSDAKATAPEGKRGGDNIQSMNNGITGNGDCQTVSQNEVTENFDDSVSATLSNSRIKTCPLRLQLSDDTAKAPPPCVVTMGSDGNDGKPKICLAYYAYNPNAHFKRSNPGMPDFGVAVLPYRSGNANGPTFDILNYLVSICEERECPDLKENDNNNCGATRGIPLRVITVADGGAVIVFGVTSGDLPCI